MIIGIPRGTSTAYVYLWGESLPGICCLSMRRISVRYMFIYEANLCPEYLYVYLCIPVRISWRSPWSGRRATPRVATLRTIRQIIIMNILIITILLLLIVIVTVIVVVVVVVVVVLLLLLLTLLSNNHAILNDMFFFFFRGDPTLRATALLYHSIV